MRFWLPDYEKRLIGELQKQQHGAQFCDTRLQTEGISIPTHSCVLGALSLHLSQRLSALPPPPAGQKQTLHLHTLKPQTLIKLIGLFYSGELEVTCPSEQKDLLAAAHLFGLSDLVVGEKGKVRNCKECSTKVEIEKRDAQIQVSPRCFRASIGTQSITQELTQTMDSSSQCEDTSLTLPQSCKNAETSTSARSSSKGCSEGEAILELSTNSSVSASCPSEIIMLHLSPSEDSSLQEVEASAGCIGASPEVEEEGKQRQVSQNNYKTGSLEPAVAQKRQVCKTVASKSMEKMQEMMETTQISIKVKLRRRTQEEMWEVVNIQDPDALVAPVRSNNSKRPSGEFTAVRLSSAQASDPHTSSPNESMSAFSDDADAVPLQSPRPVEETDEQIEKLLEDIMIGLNILPNNDKDKAKSRDQKLSHRKGSTQFQKGKYSYFGCYENDGVQHGNCSAGESSGCVQAPVSLPTAFRDLNPNSSRAKHSPENSPRSTTSRETNPEEDPKDLELLPLSTENEDNLFSMADLQFLPCLSPLDSNNNSTTVNKSPVHSYLPGRAWLMDNPTSLQFPLTAVEQKPQDAHLKPSISDDSREKFGNYDLDALPPIKQQNNRQNLYEKVVPLSVKRKCPNLGLSKTYTDVNVKTDVNINLSHCLVSLSSNNVLAKERKSVSSTPPHNESPPSDGSKPQTPIRRRLRAKTQAIGDSLRKLPDRTRRKSNRSESNPETPSPKVQKEKRKRGRPAKRKRQNKNPNPSLEISDEPTSDAKRPKLEEAPKRGPSRRTRKTVHADHSYTAKEVDNKRPPMVSLKEFEQLLKRRHLKKKSLKVVKEQSQKDETEGEAVAESNQRSDSAHSQSEEVDVTEDKDGQSQTTSTEDLNHLNSLEEPPQADDSSITECDVSEVSDQSEMCFGVIPKVVFQLSEEMEEQRAPPEEQATPPKKFNDCAPDSACEKQVPSDDSLPLTASKEEENAPTNDCRNVEDQNRSSGDEEVDILIHSSPDQKATTEGPKPVHISPDEEEEEDGDDVDVTGSDTDG
ncbi:unnamed protein product [Knipowitschia caucasica]